MRGWNFTLSIDQRASVPIFTQIAHAIADDIRRGRLRPGAVSYTHLTLPTNREV